MLCISGGSIFLGVLVFDDSRSGSSMPFDDSGTTRYRGKQLWSRDVFKGVQTRGTPRNIPHLVIRGKTICFVFPEKTMVCYNRGGI